jgi:rhomboid protease GluP
LTLYCPRCGEGNPDDATFCNFCGASLATGVRPPPPNPNVKTCFYCNKPLTGEDAFYFHCKYCGQDFCSAHRLPESHLCKSNPIRRTLPSTSSPYYTTGGGYTSSTYTKPGRGRGFISEPGKYLIILIFSGLVIGGLASLVSYDGFPLIYFLVQVNPLVFAGWVPPLVTSIIVVEFGSLGILDVVFNAISVFFVDGLLKQIYSTKQYFIVFLVTGVVGNLASLFGYGNALIVSFGASGGIFGLVAGALTCEYALTGRFNRNLVIWFVIIFVYSSILGSTDIYAHLGGAISGLIAGYYVGKSRKRTPRYAYR